MNTRQALLSLAGLVVVLATVAAGAGLLLSGSSAPYAFTTLREQTAVIFGQGLYRHDTLFAAAGYRGQDAVALFLGVPLLIFALLRYRRATLDGQLLVAGMLGYFLYLYASMALGAAYNPLFLLYVATFAASLFGFVLAITAVDQQRLAARLAALPRRAMTILMVASGLITLVVWGMPLVVALLNGSPPDRLDSYTTMVTYALDLAIITPSTFLCASLVRKQRPLGTMLATPLLVLIVLLVPQIMLSTYFQRAAGVPFTTGEMVGPVAGFVILGLLAAWLLVTILRRSAVEAPARTAVV